MDAARKADILAAYELHASIFDEVARRRQKAALLIGTSATASAPIIDDPGVINGLEPELSRRMQQVLTLIAEGDTNDAIAYQLDINSETVKTYVKRLFTVLGAQNRAHAVAIGYRSGLLGDAGAASAAAGNGQ